MSMDTPERAASVVTAIEQGLLDGKAIADVLRMCVTLSGLVGSDELRDWANGELRGYADDANVPEYRKIEAVIQIDAITANMRVTGRNIAPYQLPEKVQSHIDGTVQFREPIAQLAEQAIQREGARDSIKLEPGAAAYARQLIDQASGNPFQQTTSLYYSVPRSALAGIVDQVKTVAADFVANLRGRTPTLAEAPSAELANSAIALAISGDHANVSVVSAHGNASATSAVAGGDGDPETRVLTRRQLWWTIGGVIAAVVLAIIGWIL